MSEYISATSLYTVNCTKLNGERILSYGQCHNKIKATELVHLAGEPWHRQCHKDKVTAHLPLWNNCKNKHRAAWQAPSGVFTYL